MTPPPPSYVLSNGKSIQMVTALVLQLIQCIIKVPEIEEKKKEEPKEEVVEEVSKFIHFYTLLISPLDKS